MSLYVKVDSINYRRFDRSMYAPHVMGEADITINGVKNTYPAQGLIMLELEEMKKGILETLVDVFDMDSCERIECFGSTWYGPSPDAFVHILEDFTFDEIQEKFDKWKKSKEIHKLTVEEIEEKLGYKVEIVSEHEVNLYRF